MSDVLFEQMLAAHNQNYKDAQEFSDWMPDDGEYIVTVLKCDKGAKLDEETKELRGWWKLTGRIEDPGNEALNGKEFTLGFYRTGAMGILKGQVRVLNGGVPVGDITEVNALLEGCPGKVVRAKVETKTAKNGKDYTNSYIQEVLQFDEVPAEVPDAANDAPDEVPVEPPTEG